MIIETVLYHYECKDCGYIWSSNIKLYNPHCPKCIDTNTDWIIPFKSFYAKETLLDDPCQGCSNHPKNGGSGVCHCTIPYMRGRGITC